MFTVTGERHRRGYKRGEGEARTLRAALDLARTLIAFGYRAAAVTDPTGRPVATLTGKE